MKSPRITELTLDPHMLAEKLKTEGEKVRALFASLTEEQWRTPVYTEAAEWTPRSILAHLVTAERGFLKLFENIRLGGEGSSPEFSIDRFNARQQEKSSNLTPADLLPLYSAIRAEMVEYVAALSPADLEVRGRHPALGISTLESMIKMIYLHNQQHARDIRAALPAIPRHSQA